MTKYGSFTKFKFSFQIEVLKPYIVVTITYIEVIHKAVECVIGTE